ncbi:MBL fold metallo-hydrolase [Ornithobacterium rhinotracheale]|uniref:hypothetical protein n=1 Tax=Ornithobacterium rhinotracheale TaxID=28251 RepID=UPI001FF68E91|nr:hypothetical protein [Ornithobacterium rhinotracheale]MCK0206070.1 hypothetical protein [Ornithobacterium rhinotracheale]
MYFPKDQVLFGGCLVKELGAGKGNLSDAFPKEWSATIQKVKHAYPEAKIVVPGHGKIGTKRYWTTRRNFSNHKMILI